MRFCIDDVSWVLQSGKVWGCRKGGAAVSEDTVEYGCDSQLMPVCGSVGGREPLGVEWAIMETFCWKPMWGKERQRWKAWSSGKTWGKESHRQNSNLVHSAEFTLWRSIGARWLRRPASTTQTQIPSLMDLDIPLPPRLCTPSLSLMIPLASSPPHSLIFPRTLQKLQQSGLWGTLVPDEQQRPKEVTITWRFWRRNK